MSISQPSEKIAPTSQQDSSWGLFEPLHGVLGPIGDIVSPVVTPNVIIGMLLLVILVNWLRGPKMSSVGSAFSSMPSSQRIAAYEEIWQREESDLWDWLEERVGIQGLAYPDSGPDHEALAKARKQREQSLKGRATKKMLADLKMSDRTVDHAIRVTEEKLGVLKRSIEERQGLQGEAKKPPDQKVPEEESH